jgi:hypothetical protein
MVPDARTAYAPAIALLEGGDAELDPTALFATTVNV